MDFKWLNEGQVKKESEKFVFFISPLHQPPLGLGVRPQRGLMEDRQTERVVHQIVRPYGPATGFPVWPPGAGSRFAPGFGCSYHR